MKCSLAIRKLQIFSNRKRKIKKAIFEVLESLLGMSILPLC